MRRSGWFGIVALAACWMVIAPPPVAAAALYEGRAIVTGTDSRQRLDGFDRCLHDVLVKLSGEPALLTDPRVAAFDAGAEELAEDFHYIDRMSDVPTHDEQGTRDRPFDLAVRFSPARIDAILAKLGAAPWRGARPPLALLIAIEKDAARFPLTADGYPDERMRGAAFAAAAKYGMRVVLPPRSTPELMPHLPDAVPVHGTLLWSPKDYGWVGSWRMSWQGQEYRWDISGVSFDEAFRDLVRGAMRVASGRGGPVAPP